MWKNLILTLILIVVTFSNLTFADAPLKWKGDELFGVFHDGKSYFGIFSNYSSLVERAVCPSGYSECPGTNICCPIGQSCISGNKCSECGPNPVVCDSSQSCCLPGFKCCKKGCCKEGLLCADDIDDIGICKEEEDTEEDTLPCSLSKTGKIKVHSDTYRATAELAPFAYIYDPNETPTLTQKTLDSTIDRNKVQADHVFEAQIVTKYFKEDGRILCSHIASNSSYIAELKKIINDVTNMRYLSPEINRVKGKYFKGDSVDSEDPKLLKAVKDYLSIDDVYEAYSKTRSKLIDFFRKVAKENKLNIPNIDNIDTSFGRPEYEKFTERKILSTNIPPSSSSSTLLLPYFPVILSTTLSFVLVFGGCGQKVTIMLIPQKKSYIH
jgi:hypothetical protein